MLERATTCWDQQHKGEFKYNMKLFAKSRVGKGDQKSTEGGTDWRFGYLLRVFIAFGDRMQQNPVLWVWLGVGSGW
jgi:hypothetical protein